MNLTGFHIILDSFGTNRLPLEGEYSPESLGEVFIKSWVPYFECHKCGRWSYCKHAKHHPANPHRSIDIKCGEVVDSLRNFARATFPLLAGLQGQSIQQYLDGAFHWYSFVFDANLWIGGFMDPDIVDWHGSYAPAFFGYVARLREHLNRLGATWKEIPSLGSTSPVLFVEGFSEKEFLNELRKSGVHPFRDLHIEVYEGRGNRTKKRIDMLLKQYKAQGYNIYAQGDADGHNTDIFRQFTKSGLIDRKNTFVFAHDFETAIPTQVLYAILCELELVNEISEEGFRAALSGRSVSVISHLKNALGIDIVPYKMEIANCLARILNTASWECFQSKEFMTGTELGRFLDFVVRII